MTMEEKLFVQIFERKNSIIEQVRQQTEMYIQNLASKLLIDGITPPPWLWNPNSHSRSSDPKELNKEELISKILLQTSRNVAPYVSGQCSVYDKPVTTRDNAELSGRYCMDTHVSSKKINGSISMLESRDNDVGCALNGVPDLDFSVNSPLDETDARISNIYSAPDQSLARIQRSRSRQKALELRTSAKAAGKSRLNHENGTGICYRENSLSQIDFPQDIGSSKSPKHYDVRGKNTGSRESNTGNCGKGFSISSYRNGITKSRSPCKETISVTQFRNDGYSKVEKENGDVLLQSAHNDSVLKEMTNTSDATSGSSIAREATEGKCWDKHQGSEFCGRIIRSRISSLQAYFINGSSLDTSTYTAKAGSATLAQSTDKPAEEVACSNKLLKAVMPTRELIGRKTRSQTTSCSEDTVVPVKSSSIAASRITRSRSGATKESPLAKSLNKNENDALPNMSDCQLDASTYTAKAGSATLAQLMDKPAEEVACSDKLVKAVIPSGEPIGRKTRSQATSCSEDTSLPVKSSGIAARRITRSRSGATKESSLAKSLNKNENYALPNTSGCRLDASTNYTTKAGSATLAHSMDKPAEEVACSNKLLQPVIPSGEPIGRKTRSQATSCSEDTSLPVKSSGIAARRITCSKSDATKESPFAKSLKKNGDYALPNASGCQLMPLCPIDVNQHGNAEVGIQLVDGHAEAQPLYLGSNFIGAPLIKDSDGLVLSPSSNSHIVVQPKQLVFDDMEEHIFSKNFSPSLREERVNRSSGEGYSALLDTLASPDEVTHEVTPDRPNEGFWKEHSQTLKNVPTKLEEAQNNVNVEDCSEDEIGNFESKVIKNQVANTGECNSEAALHNQVSFLEDGAPSDFLSNSDKEAHLENCEVIGGYRSSYKLQLEEVDSGSKEKNNISNTPSKSMHKLEDPSVISTLAKQKNAYLQNCLDKEVGIPEPTGFDEAMQLHVQDMQNILHVENTDTCPERMLVESSTDVGEDDVSAHCLIGLQCMDNNYASFSGQPEVQFAKSSLLPKMKINPTEVESWPQTKRRKVEYQLFNGFSASPSFRVQMPHNIRRGTCRYLENTGSISGSGRELQVLSLSEEGKLSQPNASKGSDVGTYDERQYHLTSDIDFSPSLQFKEVEFGSEFGNKTVGTPFTFNDQQSRPSYLQSLTNKAADGSTDSFSEGVKTADPTSRLGDGRNMCPGYKVSEVNGDNLTADRNFPKGISHVTGDGLLSYLSARSPHNDRDSVGPDDTMPVFEGFITDGQTENGGVDNAGDMISFNTSEHARILEEICKSASMQTPLSHFSSKFKVHGIQDLYQSVPNGLLECADLKSTFPLDMDAHKRHASYSCAEEVKTSLYGVTFSNSLSYSGTPFSCNSRNHYPSPVGKLWERFSSSSSSSEKRLSFNPELTCFPIEEDPSDSEENENAEEADDIQQDIVSRVLDDSAKRQPLVEITEACGPAPSISASEKHLNRDSLESVTTEFSFHGTHNSVKQKLRNHRSNKRSTKEGKENQTSLGAQSTKRGIKSLQSRFSKPKVSGKASLRQGVERLSQKEPNQNNIVTGLTSFIPLVQQKQAAAICPAKRDIKVKALEAAEAAKRLEEKRANERKMKKEALKLERARLEKEKLREMELNKKKKQEEQKKRDADIAARKRLREEEEDERKEKEKKRKCVAEGRREQKLAEEKLRAGKVKKVKHGKMGEKVIRGKESENPLEKKKNIVNECGDENYLKKPNTHLQSSYVLEDPDAASYCDNEGKQMSMLEKTAERNDSAAVRSLEKSYDISPYQCSDDDEEENEIPTTKFIPSWASVDIALTLQKNLDPDVIFPRESFCSMDEVLQPRRRPTVEINCKS